MKTTLKKTLKRLSGTIPPAGIYIQRYFISLSFLDKEKSLTLDIGCGEGGVSNFLTRCGKKVVGIDIDNIRKKKFPFIKANAEKLPFKDSVFDQIVCLDVIEHVYNDKLLAREIDRVLKSNGNLILTTPTKSWKYPYYGFMKKITPSEKSLLNFFGHLRRGYTLTEIKKMFKNFEVRGIKYYPNKIGALAFDIEYSNLFIIKNIILRILALPLFLNFKLSSKKHGTFIGVKLSKIR